MLIFVAIGAGFIALYSLLITAFSVGWLQTPSFRNKKNTSLPKASISVLVAVRNEEANIKHLIACINKQNLLKDEFELIIIDDHSTDNTPFILKQLASKHNWMQVIKQKNGFAGKKAALSAGLETAKNELIVFTDADCSLPTTWLQSYWQFYCQQKHPDLIIGLVDMQTTSPLQHFFRLDFLSLILSSAGASAFSPIFCNGANMAVKYKAISKTDYNSSLTSGDDVFLLHNFKANNKRICLLKTRTNLVKTQAPTTLNEFINQRHRWASKTPYYKDFFTITLAITVLCANLFFIPVIIALLTNNASNYALVLIAAKFAPELFLFFSGNSLLNLRTTLRSYPIFALIYPVYIGYTALSALALNFTWKDRKARN